MIGNAVGQGSAGDLNLSNYNARVTAGGGTTLSEPTILSIYQFLQQQNLLTSSQLIYDANTGLVQRTDGVLKYIRTAFDLSPSLNNLDGSATATAQPRLVGGIAPNSKVAANNQSGELRYFIHTPISFTAGQSWSLSIMLRTNWHNESTVSQRVLGSRSTASGTLLYLNSVIGSAGLLSFRNQSNNAINSSNSFYNIIGKSTILTLTAEGNGTIKIYKNGTFVESLTLASDIELDTLMVSTNAPSVTNCFKGNIYNYRIQSGAMTAAQVLSEATFLRTLYPEIESVVIGTQEWATRNFEAVCTPMGNVIPEMQAAAAVEKITNAADRDFSSDTGYWTKEAGWSIGSNKATFDGTSGGKSLYKSGLLTVGKWYKVSVEILDLTTGAVTFAGFTATAMTSNGVKTFVLKATSTLFGVFTSSATFFNGSIDNISCQELGWSNATEIYDAVYAATAGDAATKHYAACKEAGMWCYYNNSADNGATYGKLYNYYGVSLLDLDFASASFGWRVPTSAQITTLQTYLGGNLVSGGKLKMSGTSYWATPNTGADNSSGFTALGSGYRSNLGAPTNLTGGTILGTSTTDGTYFTTMTLSNVSEASTITAFGNRLTGVSLRLIKV